jgi:hypothetical protein
MKKLFDGLAESIPLTFFVIYIHSVEMSVRQDWIAPYFIACIVSIAVILYLARMDRILNRIFIGTSAYFITGAIGLTIGWNWLNDLYGEWRALGLLYWILATGVVTLFCSRYGFMGIERVARGTVRLWSLLLLMVCCASIAIARISPSNPLLAEWIPFLLIFLMKGLFEKVSQNNLRGIDVARKIFR